MERELNEGLHIAETDGNQITIRQVKDSYDETHIIRKKLGQGGQGVVCVTEDAEIVIKFSLNSKMQIIGREKNPKEFARNDREFKSIILKPFPDRLHLAYPMARLQDYSGYVMRLMGDMIPFGDLLANTPEQIAQIPQTGGHRRRFLLLSKLASLLAKIHGAGMVYCDLSPNNVFVTKDSALKTQNVWLIDADNVFVPGEDADKLVYTPRYAAPELLSGSPCSQNSDVYSFATLAFETLAALHPFAGEKATNWDDDDGDDWDASTNGKAQTLPAIDPQYSGKIAWVEDTEDDSNHTDAGLPRQHFLTDETFRLFNMTFCENGRTKPNTRPSATVWARAFAHSHALSVQCTESDCGMSFVYDGSQKVCPWCEKSLPAVFTLTEGNRLVFAHELQFVSDGFGEEFFLPEHLFVPFDIDTNARAVLCVRSVEKNGRGIEFSLLPEISAEHSFFITTEKGEEKLRSRYTLFLQGGTYSLRYENTRLGIQKSFSLGIREGA